jgi:hypothetical protein
MVQLIVEGDQWLNCESLWWQFGTEEQHAQEHTVGDLEAKAPEAAAYPSSAAAGRS